MENKDYAGIIVRAGGGFDVEAMAKYPNHNIKRTVKCSCVIEIGNVIKRLDLCVRSIGRRDHFPIKTCNILIGEKM